MYVYTHAYFILPWSENIDISTLSESFFFGYFRKGDLSWKMMGWLRSLNQYSIRMSVPKYPQPTDEIPFLQTVNLTFNLVVVSMTLDEFLARYLGILERCFEFASAVFFQMGSNNQLADWYSQKDPMNFCLLRWCRCAQNLQPFKVSWFTKFTTNQYNDSK